MPNDVRRVATELVLRVYYEDTDSGGVVYYANYLKYLERGRTEWLRSLGVEQQNLADRDGLVFAVRHLDIDYHRPARLDDRVRVLTTPTEIGRASVVFEQSVSRDEDKLVGARVRVACVDQKKLKPAAIPDWLRTLMNRTESP